MSSTGVDTQQSSESSPSGQRTPTVPGTIAAIKVDGYQFFSRWISSDPLRSTTIFRRFDRLAIRNLLYLESELAVLEHELDELDNGDIPETWINHLGDWNLLRSDAEVFEADPNEVPQEIAKEQELLIARMKLVRKIREKVKEYHEALKLTCEIFTLERPEKGDIETNGRVFVAAGKDEYDNWQKKARTDAIIQSQIADHLCDENQSDLCSLAPQVERDPLTRLVESKHQLRNIIKDKKTQMVDPIKYRRFTKAVTWISVALVVAWLVGAIVGLYFWKSDHGRLILLSLLTLGFAFSILSLTTARRHDVFSSTAAYAAVLVVFIGSTLDNSGTGRDTTTAAAVAERVSRTRLLPRDVLPTRTYVAADYDALELHFERKKVSELVSGMFFVAGVVLCAFVLLGMRKRGYKVLCKS